jgi:hypothetical protein
MPPWKAVSGFGSFKNERRLTPREIEIIEAWARAGAPEGDPTEEPPLGPVGTPPEPDLVLTMARPFVVPAAGDDVYRTFVIGSLPHDTMLRAIEFRPGGTGGVVHHANVFSDEGGVIRRIEETSGTESPKLLREGLASRVIGDDAYLSVWSGGVGLAPLDPGIGRLAKKGDIVVEAHYRPNGRAQEVQSSLALYFAAPPVSRRAQMFRIGRLDLVIPPGEESYRASYEATLPFSSTLLAVRAHMHLLGKEVRVTATLPWGEAVPMVWLKDWNYQWQPFYEYSRPIALPKGTRVQGEALYDNSDKNPLNPSKPPRTVNWGWGIRDEMCSFYLDVAFDTEDDLRAFRAWRRARKPPPAAREGSD